MGVFARLGDQIPFDSPTVGSEERNRMLLMERLRGRC